MLQPCNPDHASTAGLLPAVLGCGHDHVKDQYENAVQNHLAAKAFKAGRAYAAQAEDHIATHGLMTETVSEVQCTFRVRNSIGHKTHMSSEAGSQFAVPKMPQKLEH